MSASRVTHRYVPANTRADLPPGSKHLAMDALLMSDDVADVTRDVSRAIAVAASTLATSVGVDTGAFVDSFYVEETTPILAGEFANPRRTMEVGSTDPGAPHHEFGGRRRVGAGHVVDPPRDILGQASRPYSSPRVSDLGGFA